jgi:NADH dehydrogenase [ubiquinone] 1 alpha subcomplex assembly factor 1
MNAFITRLALAVGLVSSIGISLSASSFAAEDGYDAGAKDKQTCLIPRVCQQEPNTAQVEQVNMVAINNEESPNSHIRFSQKSEVDNWVIVNDTVMGGRSRAGLGVQDEYLIFAGDLSMRNNGGFASTRRVYAPIEWGTKQDIQLKVKGDGRAYQFRLRTDRGFDGVAYTAEFKTIAGEDQTFTFELSDFTPVFRGRLVTNAPPLQFKDVSQIGFMLADKKPGQFVLLVQEIKQLPEFI